MSLYCVGKVLNCFGTSCGTSSIPRICTIWNSVYALSIHMSKLLSLEKQPFCLKSIFFAWHLFMHMLNISVLYMQSIRKDSVKALVQVDFPMYALSKQNKQTEKLAKFTKLSFCQKLIFWQKTSSCKCSMCLYYVGKVSDSFRKSSSISWFPHACTIWALTKPLLRSKVFKNWLSSKCCHFVRKYFYGIKLLHANVQCVYIVCTKYQDASIQAVEGVELLVYALPTCMHH